MVFAEALSERCVASFSDGHTPWRGLRSTGQVPIPHLDCGSSLSRDVLVKGATLPSEALGGGAPGHTAPQGIWARSHREEQVPGTPSRSGPAEDSPARAHGARPPQSAGAHRSGSRSLLLRGRRSPSIPPGLDRHGRFVRVLAVSPPQGHWFPGWSSLSHGHYRKSRQLRRRHLPTARASRTRRTAGSGRPVRALLLTGLQSCPCVFRHLTQAWPSRTPCRRGAGRGCGAAASPCRGGGL